MGMSAVSKEKSAMSAQFCESPNHFSSSFTPHLASFYLLVAQVAFKSVAGTGQENPTANSSEKIRNVS